MRLPYIKVIIFAMFSILIAGCSFAQNKQVRSPAAQRAIDEQLLQEYFKKNNIQPIKTTYGLYYTISKEGAGKTVMAGQTVTVNYTGRLLDGKAFDSNTDPAFQHVGPLSFEVGVGKVIRGWDKGLQLLKKDAKATLYIPSGMAYGPSADGPIPANAILVFDIDVLDVTR